MPQTVETGHHLDQHLLGQVVRRVGIAGLNKGPAADPRRGGTDQRIERTFGVCIAARGKNRQLPKLFLHGAGFEKPANMSIYDAKPTRCVYPGMDVPLLTGKSSDFLKIGVAAAGRGDLDTVSTVLAEKPDWLRRIGSHGRTMLWEAAYRGRGAMVDYLADLGADIEARGCHFTPLLVEVSPYCAARVKNHDVVAQGLLARGAVVDVCTAAYLGDVAAVRDNLAANPDLVATEQAQHDPNVRATVLHYAVAAGHLDVVRLVLAQGADPRPYGYWLIRFCIWRQRADILEALIEGGLDPASSELRLDRQGDHRPARSPRRFLWPGSRRGRLAADRLPVAWRPGRQRGARA